MLLIVEMNTAFFRYKVKSSTFACLAGDLAFDKDWKPTVLHEGQLRMLYTFFVTLFWFICSSIFGSRLYREYISEHAGKSCNRSNRTDESFWCEGQNKLPITARMTTDGEMRTEWPSKTILRWESIDACRFDFNIYFIYCSVLCSFECLALLELTCFVHG